MSEETVTKNTEFKYGWCHTDHKDGKKIRENWREIDYMQDASTADFVSKTLKMYGLPQPDLKNEVFRGTHHDLLFLDSHGVVLRIGPTNVEELVNPAIIQPLHWTDDKNSDIAIAIYPGIELYKNIDKHDNSLGNLDDLRSATERFGNEDHDSSKHNAGFIRVMDNKGSEGALPIILDADAHFNKSTKQKPSLNKSKTKSSEKGVSHTNALEAIFNEQKSNLIDKDFNEAIDVGLYMQAFEYHQPIRRIFTRAFSENSNTPDPKLLNQAWQMIGNYHNHGYGIWKRPKKTIDASVAQAVKNQMKRKMGFKEDPATTASLSKREVEKRRLHSPWSTDKALKLGKVTMENIPADKLTVDVCAKRLEVNPMDVKDLPAKYKTKKLCMVAFNQDSDAIKYIPDEHQTSDMWKKALESNGSLVSEIPERFATKELFLIAINGDADVITLVPKNVQDKDMWLLALSKDGRLLRELPESYRNDEDLIKTAVANDRNALRFLPEDFKIKSIYDYAFEHDKRAIINIPDFYLSNPTYKDALKEHPSLLEYVPHHRQTKKMCRDAYSQHSRVIYNMNPKFLTKDMWRAELKESPYYFLERMDKRRITAEMCSFLLRSDAEYITAVPQDLITYDTAEYVVNKLKGHHFGFIPKRLHSQALCELAVSLLPGNISCIADKYKTKEMCLKAFKDSPYNFQHIPEEHQNAEMRLSAVEYDSENIQYVSYDNQTKEMVSLAYQKSTSIACYVAPEYLTKKMYKAAIEDYGVYFIRNRNPEHITEHMCELAIKESPYVIADIPESKRTRELYELAFKSSENVLECLPYADRTPDVCIMACSHSTYALSHIPIEHFSNNSFLRKIATLPGIKHDYLPWEVHSKQSIVDRFLHYQGNYKQNPESELTEIFSKETEHREIIKKTVNKGANSMPHTILN